MAPKQLYFRGLMIVLPYTTMLGMFASYDNKTRVGLDRFVNTIGTTSIGVITGLIYPVSVPIMTGYTLYDIYKQSPPNKSSSDTHH